METIESGSYTTEPEQVITVLCTPNACTRRVEVQLGMSVTSGIVSLVTGLIGSVERVGVDVCIWRFNCILLAGQKKIHYQ